MKSVRASWIGTLVLGIVLYLGVFSGFKDLTVFFNSHALILVFGGTLAVMLMSYPLSVLTDIFDFLVYGFYLKKQNNVSNTITSLLSTIYEIKKDPRNVANVKTSHIFINEGVRLSQDPAVDAVDMFDVLTSIKESFYRKYSEDAKVMTNIAKFPPALGLLGASTGMIDMMMNLGTGGTSVIGASMAVALTATFWGIAAANFIFLPLADYATRLAEEDLFIRGCITEAFVMNKEERDFNVIVEIICGKLPVQQRFETKTLLQVRIMEIESRGPLINKGPHVVKAS